MLLKNKIIHILLLAIYFSGTPFHLEAAVREYILTIKEQQVNITGTPVKGMTINDVIPGPTLRFKEGDLARIHVRNEMQENTSIHWHGILVPPGMDGVPNISFPPIKPGSVFTYEFPVRQAGTYWYHSHSDLQEQSGVYGSIVIEPKNKRYHPDRDYVVLLSDWSDESPHAILRTLKRGSEWYALTKGSGQSILGAAKLGMLGDYFIRELQRMPPMDIADVAYDRFLANGKTEIALTAAAGETVRLRIIDGSATTYFHLKFAGGPMTVISADGLDVEPVKLDPLLIAVAETYDVLVTLPDSGSYELRATAHDGSAFASVWLGSGKKFYATDIPKPNLYAGMDHFSLKSVFALTPAGVMSMPDSAVKAGKFDQPGMMGMDAMEHMDHKMHKNMQHQQPQSHSMDQSPHLGHQMEQHKTMDHADHNQEAMHGMDMKHASHSMQERKTPINRSGKKFATNFRFLGTDTASSPDLAMDGMHTQRPWPPYDDLKALKSTALPGNRKPREIRLTLDGDMERYVWFLNNKPLSESDYILIKQNEVVRFIMINRTMMHHPMHLHGHFFRVLNKHGDYSPLKHTVNVAPMSTTVIEFDANEFGDWFFHCHLLYHMKSGMARMVHYEDYTPGPDVTAVRPNLYKEHWYFWGNIDAMSHMGMGKLSFANTRHILNLAWQIGWEKVEDTEWEATPTWSYYSNRFFQVFVGIDLDGIKDELETQKAVVGIHYLLPLNLEFMTWFDSYGEFRFAVEKELELTPRFMLFGEAEYDTDSKWEGHAGVSYLLSKNISLLGQWHSDFGPGGGLQIRF